MWRVRSMRLAIVSLTILAIACPTAHAEDVSWKGAFAPLPDVANSTENPITPEKVALGKKLYLDTRLSKDETLSCNSCHNLKTFGVDILQLFSF